MYALYTQPFKNYLSTEAIIYYFACIVGLFGISLIFNDFKVVTITHDTISLKPIFGKMEIILFSNITGYKTYYHTRTASSNHLGYNIKDNYKSLAIFLKDKNRIDIHGSNYKNWNLMLELIIKRLL
jgi:hypothetical protein